MRNSHVAYVQERIEQTVFAIIRARGITQFSMRELAKAVDMSPANLYEYFENKEAIVRYIYVRLIEKLKNYIGRVEATLSAEQYLITLCLAYWHFAHTNREQMLMMQQLGFTTPALGRSKASLQELDIVDTFVEGAERFVASTRNGSIITPKELAYTLLALAHGFALMELTYPGRIRHPAIYTAIQTIRITSASFIGGFRLILGNKKNAQPTSVKYGKTAYLQTRN